VGDNSSGVWRGITAGRVPSLLGNFGGPFMDLERVHAPYKLTEVA